MVNEKTGEINSKVLIVNHRSRNQRMLYTEKLSAMSTSRLLKLPFPYVLTVARQREKFIQNMIFVGDRFEFWFAHRFQVFIYQLF